MWMIAIEKSGGLLVADDLGNAVWRITAANSAARRRRQRFRAKVHLHFIVANRPDVGSYKDQS
jgi:hypothetical protein